MAKNSEKRSSLPHPKSNTNQTLDTPKNVGKSKLKKQRKSRRHSQPESEKRDHSEEEPKKPMKQPVAEPEPESESESESEEEPKQPMKQQPNPVAEPKSDSESESESKSQEEPLQPMKQQLNPVAEPESEEEPKKKRKRLSAAGEAESSKNKKAFQRIWSDEDENVLLNGLVEFQKDGRKLEDMDAFHSFIKDKLHMQVTKIQIQSKIRTLKKKHQNNKNKEFKFKEGDGVAKESFELSKLLWGSEVLKPVSKESMNSVLEDDKEWKKLLVHETEAYIRCQSTKIAHQNAKIVHHNAKIEHQNAKIARANHLLNLIKSSS